jgi:hypothetical protein
MQVVVTDQAGAGRAIAADKYKELASKRHNEDKIGTIAAQSATTETSGTGRRVITIEVRVSTSGLRASERIKW